MDSASIRELLFYFEECLSVIPEYSTDKQGHNLVKIGRFASLCGLTPRVLRRMNDSGEFVADFVSVEGFRYYREDRRDDARKLVWTPKIMDGGRNVIVDCPDLEHDFAYVWGLIMADGCVMGDGLSICLEMKDEQIIRDIATIVGGNVHKRGDREMWRVIVPRYYSKKIIALGAERRKGKGFDVPPMSENTFCDYLRGLFDGDGSVGERYTRSLSCSIAGHPRAMAYIQKTLFEHFGLYMAWNRKVSKKFPDSNTGQLGIANRDSVGKFHDIIYRFDGVCLKRKKMVFNRLAA